MISQCHARTDFFLTLRKICPRYPILNRTTHSVQRSSMRTTPTTESSIPAMRVSQTDRDRKRIEVVVVRPVEHFLFLTKNRPPERPEPLDLPSGFGAILKNKILGSEAIERIRRPCSSRRGSNWCAASTCLLLSLLETGRDDDDPGHRS